MSKKPDFRSDDPWAGGNKGSRLTDAVAMVALMALVAGVAYLVLAWASHWP